MMNVVDAVIREIERMNFKRFLVIPILSALDAEGFYPVEKAAMERIGKDYYFH